MSNTLNRGDAEAVCSNSNNDANVEASGSCLENTQANDASQDQQHSKSVVSQDGTGATSILSSKTGSQSMPESNSEYLYSPSKSFIGKSTLVLPGQKIPPSR